MNIYIEINRSIHKWESQWKNGCDSPSNLLDRQQEDFCSKFFQSSSKGFRNNVKGSILKSL